MGRPKSFDRKIYCGNCGGWIASIGLETREGSHAHDLKLVINHEPCSSAGTNTREYKYKDIYPEKQYKNRPEMTVSTVYKDETVPVLAESAPIEQK